MALTPLVGELLRSWRTRRRFSQRDLATDAAVSTKHLSSLETGRAVPSREMVLRLAECMDVPLRDRNTMLTATGYAAVFHERALDHPELGFAREGIEAILAAAEPNPAVAVDRHWTQIACNPAWRRLIAGADPLLLRPAVNVPRVCLHPAGLGPRLANLREWREHVTNQLRRQIKMTGDPFLSDLLEEILDYPLPRGAGPVRPRKAFDGVIVPFRLVTIDGTLSFCSTTTTFDSSVDVTLSEVRIKSFFPTDPETAAILRKMAQGGQMRSSEELMAAAVMLNRYPVMAGDDPPPVWRGR